ncbi:MAG: T9SS type A sorting domain-containing protein, partial [Bacteroidales bacterium]|nr:T9SS type A sorting domain-containing protein [Bacteroidales bacterium]
ILKISSNTLNFNTLLVEIGDTTKEIKLYNIGTAGLSIDSISTVQLPFSISGEIPDTIQPEDSTVISVSLSTDTLPGNYTTTLWIYTNDIDTFVAISVILEESYTPPPVTNDTSICEGDTIKYITATGVDLSWYEDSLLTILLSEEDTLNVNLFNPGEYKYYVTQTIDNVESLPDSVIINIYSNPVITSVEKTDATSCAADDGTITINATGDEPLEYSVDDGVNYILDNTATGLETGNYPVVVKSIWGCLAYGDTVTITSPDAPPAPLLSNDTTYCYGDSLEDIIGTAQSGGILTWYSNVELTEVIGTGTNLKPDNVIGTSIYYLTETVDDCESESNSVSITILQNPVPPDADDASICLGDIIPDLTATGDNICWYADSLLTSSLGCENVYEPVDSSVGSYSYYAIQTVYGCESAPKKVTLVINPLPVVDLGSDTSSCSTSGITLDAGTGYTSYSWNNGVAETQTHTVTVSGDYFVAVTDNNSCTGSDTINVNFVESYTPRPEICKVTYNNDQYELYWAKPSSAQPVNMYIERESYDRNDIYFLMKDTVDYRTGQYIYSEIEPEDGPYRYSSYTFDDCGNHSDWSITHGSINLNIYYGHNLGWNEYEGKTTEGYEIYRGSSDSDMELYDEISGDAISWSDQNPASGTNYYKIAAVLGDISSLCDLQGSDADKSFSNVVSDENLEINNLSYNNIVNIYPNPVKDELIIDLIDNQYEFVKIIISTVTGEEVYYHEFDNITKDGLIELKVMDVSDGLYIINIFTDQFNYSDKIVIRK